MELTNETRAKVISEALPYLREYAGRTVVVKYGGAAMENIELKNAVMSDIVLLSLIGVKIVLVHGGGPEINALLKKIGKEPKFINGLRYTDDETIDAVQMVLSGKVNKQLTALIAQHGGKALGLCGLDGEMLVAEKHISTPDLGLVGDIVKVDTKPIETALDSGYIPVIATVAGDRYGKVYNINADTAAAKIAAALKARNLLLMTDIKGLLRDVKDPSSLIKLVKLHEVPALIHDGVITGGMLPKIDCCVEAVRYGVHKANIIDGRLPHSILLELLTDEGVGTMIE
ncbi:MAG: acetylglutamate kinase [Oscillospiraceae bacterium]|jgi:acetylglutamate kinase|nr:acetylglutamate kinase [Oscillospiraceae bacterium]